MTGIDRTRTHRVATTTAVAIALVLAAVRLGLGIEDPEAGSTTEPFGGGWRLAVIDALVLVMFAVLGAVVTRKRPTNAVGWILCVIPVSLGALLLSSHLYERLVVEHPHGLATELAAWLASWVWIPFVIPALTLFPLLFPTGRPLTPRWRWVVVLAVASMPVSFIGVAFEPGPLEDYPTVVNPVGATGVLEVPIQAVGLIGFAMMLVATLASAVSIVVRFRRSRGEERQQLKWVATAAALFAINFMLPEPLVGEEWGFALLLLGLLVVEVAVAIAMLRYRLYDIDVVINRALVYGSLTATLAGVYVGSVLLLQLVLSDLTQGSGLAVAASTLAVAALFQPARRRIQEVVDRRFFRSRYDAARTVEAFGARLRDEVDLAALSADLQSVATETMRPTHVSLWLRTPGEPA